MLRIPTIAPLGLLVELVVAFVSDTLVPASLPSGPFEFPVDVGVADIGPVPPIVASAKPPSPVAVALFSLNGTGVIILE